MRIVRKLFPVVAVVAASLIACKGDSSSDAGAADDCQQSICPAPATGRVYQSCTQNGGASCSYVTSDGQIFACASCSDCASAIALIATFCAGKPATMPEGGVVDSGQDAPGTDGETPDAMPTDAMQTDEVVDAAADTSASD